MARTELATMAEELVDDILRMPFNQEQSDIRSIVNNVAEQDFLDLLRNSVIGQMLDAHIAKFFDTDAAAEGLSKRMLAWNFFSDPIATFVR